MAKLMQRPARLRHEELLGASIGQPRVTRVRALVGRRRPDSGADSISTQTASVFVQ